MTRRRWIAIAGILLLLAAAIFTLFRRTVEPKYGGKRLSKWIDDISPTSLTRAGPTAVFWTAPRRIKTRDGQIMIVQANIPGLPRFVSGPFGLTAKYPPEHIAAVQAIREIGTNAVPHLLRTIYARDPSWKTKLINLWSKQKWLKVPFKTAVEKQERALPALRQLGPAAVWTWVEILTNELASVEVQQYAAGSLAEMRSGAVPALATLLHLQDHTNYTIRGSIGAAIQYCDTDGLLSSLYNLRHSSNANSRASAAWTLGYIGKAADMSIPSLVRAANDSSAHVRASALDALSKFGSDALATTNVIIRALNDPERRVRKAATNALNQLLGNPVTD